MNNRQQRDAQQLTVVEGVREVSRALSCQILPVEAYICPPLITGEEAAAVAQQLYHLEESGQTRLYEVTPAVFAKMAYRGQSGGILMVIPYMTRPLNDIPLSPTPFLVVIEGGEKPGNLGAILRTADAAGVDGVIISEDETRRGTDVHNPNAIRASLGALFSVPVAVAATGEVIDWLRRQLIHVAITTPDATEVYTSVNLSGPIAIVMGSEAHGLSNVWFKNADIQIGIPMQGLVDSLNLSVATAVILYEVIRQREGQPTKQPSLTPA
ncbi:MAG: RNA methyltransferase [Chloroflexi bacterium]|nr:RNA methyltransferase [Chloroflexota bacterium]